MKNSDAAFCSVPISTSDESSGLCRAHIQKVISSHLSKFIWTPLSSDSLLSLSGFSELLHDLGESIARDSRSGSRTAIFWRALTVQALHKLPITAAQPRSPQKSGSQTRVARVITGVMRTLRPLIEPSMPQDLKLPPESFQQLLFTYRIKLKSMR